MDWTAVISSIRATTNPDGQADASGNLHLSHTTDQDASSKQQSVFDSASLHMGNRISWVVVHAVSDD
jgi:hypothetical protein